MVDMTCEEHDRIAASTQFITHTVGRVLGEMNVSATPIDTRGYQSLLSLVDNTTHDSFELYYGLFMYNQVEMCMHPITAWPFMLVAAGRLNSACSLERCNCNCMACYSGTT